MNVKPIHAGRPLNLVVLRTVTGATTILVTRHPQDHLAHLGTELELDERLIVQTEYADEIAAVIRGDLDAKRMHTHAGSWFFVDWESVVRLVDDFDHDTGRRIRLDDIAVGDVVWARLATADDPRELRKATVIGITGRLYLVEFAVPTGDLATCPFPRQLLKPHVIGQHRVAVREAA